MVVLSIDLIYCHKYNRCFDISNEVIIKLINIFAPILEFKKDTYPSYFSLFFSQLLTFCALKYTNMLGKQLVVGLGKFSKELAKRCSVSISTSSPVTNQADEVSVFIDLRTSPEVAVK